MVLIYQLGIINNTKHQKFLIIVLYHWLLYTHIFIRLEQHLLAFVILAFSLRFYSSIGKGPLFESYKRFIIDMHLPLFPIKILV